MKTILLTASFILITTVIIAQTVPVTLHFKPDYTEFQVLRLVGTFNNWNNADDQLLMNDSDGNGEYEITIDLPSGIEHNYKFVMDADWGFAYTDPDNPDFNINDNNNSLLVVKDPMITYLLPRGVNSRDEKFIDATPDGLPVRAIFAFTAANPLNINSLSVTIDGVPLQNPSQYYNADKKEFLYQPDPALAKGEHTVSVSISSAAGSDTKTSTFIRDPDYVAYEIPVDFYYDQYNTSVTSTQTLTGVSLVGGFNNWNGAFNPMQDQDKDGLWETTAILTPAEYEYKFKLNNIYWVNDPDEPLFGTSADLNSYIEVKADSIPSIKLIKPADQTVFSEEGTIIEFSALLRPGIKSSGVLENSIKLKVNGTAVSANYDAENLLVNSNIILGVAGRYLIEIEFTNAEGLTALETYSYGIYNKDTGQYYVDAAGDELYNYPAGTANGSADILSVGIDETEGHDSLKFEINIADITDRTRIGFIIANSTAGNTLISDPLNLDIKTIDWNGQGIFISIGAPGNQFENSSVENRIMTQTNPALYSDIFIDVNDDALSSDIFEFRISLAVIDSLIGSWTQPRKFYAFSFLADEDKSGNGYEVTASENGSTSTVDPDIYDAAFIRSGFWQQRMLVNYIPAGQTGGPRFAALDGKGRGVLSLTANEISDSLATFGPEITFLTPGVEYWYSNVTVHGQVSDTAITSVEAYFNNVKTILPVSSGKFSMPVTLNEGANIFYILAEDSRGYKSISRNLTLTYKAPVLLNAHITGVISGRQVTLTANASSPAGTQFNYTWSADPKNPAVINVASTTNTTAANIPQINGEYFFNVRVRDAKNKITNARIMVVAEDDSLFIPGINYHSKWIDDAIVYEIYPRSFSQQGGFQGVTDKVSYLKDLGINTIWFMPVYTGPTTHGYEITDYYGFEEDYGTESDFRLMVTTLKNNGIRVILDYVVNHTSVLHPFMQNVFQYKEYSPWADFYLWQGEAGNSNYQFYFDWSSLPNLNHNNADVRKYFIDAAKHWVSFYGIDGFRCDVAWGVEERNSLFWQEWREALKNIKPEVFLQAEASSVEQIFYQQRFDSANDWELRNKILGALNGTVTLQNLHQEVTRNYPDHARPFRFIENHDELRVASLLDAKRSVLSHTLLFTMNGIPLIYSGGEVGELTRREMINWNDPENVRPYFKKLISIRKDYIHNPVIHLISNSDSSNVYSYSSVSGSNNIITAANFRNEVKNISLNLSSMPFNGTSSYYLTDLISGTVYEVTPAQRNAYPLSLAEFEAKVFYYGLDSVVVSADEIAGENLPEEYELFQNYPNPFNPLTKIKFNIKEPGNVTLKIFDVLGAEVTTLLNEMKNPGSYEVDFNAASLSSGIYFYRINAGKYISTKKLLLLK